MSPLRGEDVVIAGATEDETAAILAAYEVLWPKAIAPNTGPEPASPWRFSGRWWDRSPRTVLRR